METVESKILKALDGMTVADALCVLDKCKDTLEKAVSVVVVRITVVVDIGEIGGGIRKCPLEFIVRLSPTFKEVNFCLYHFTEPQILVYVNR